MEPEETLVSRAAAGSADAFDELVGRYRARIYRLARALTGGDTDVDDLVQDTFVRALRGIGHFRGDSAFKTWLYRIAMNVIRTDFRRRMRRAGIVTTLDDQNLAGSSLERLASDVDVEADALRRQLIDRALASLPEEMRAVVTLRDIHGFEYHEIAEVLGLPLGTVESRVFRARRRLRPLLEPLIGRSEASSRPDREPRVVSLPERRRSNS